jgi:hypothetical protein
MPHPPAISVTSDLWCGTGDIENATASEVIDPSAKAPITPNIENIIRTDLSTNEFARPPRPVPFER